MTDKDLRSRILDYLYQHRDGERIDELTPRLLDVEAPERAVTRVAKDLKGLGLVEGVDADSADRLALLSPKISARGVDVVEGEAPAPVAMNQMFNLNGPVTASQFGNQNTMEVAAHIQALIDAIDASDLGRAEKNGAKRRLKGFLESPGLGNVFQGVGVILEAMK